MIVFKESCSLTENNHFKYQVLFFVFRIVENEPTQENSDTITFEAYKWEIKKILFSVVSYLPILIIPTFDFSDLLRRHMGMTVDLNKANVKIRLMDERLIEKSRKLKAAES